MHDWGDDWLYWDDLDEAARFISDYCSRWGRFGGQAKEKFGTLRFYALFHHNLHDLIWPGYVFTQWTPALAPLRWLDDYVYRLGVCNPLRSLVIRWQTFVYARAYRLALKRWPHLRREILCCADYPEYLKVELGDDYVE